MHLLLDAGNTRIKLALYDGANLRIIGAVTHEQLSSLSDLLREQPRVDGVLGGNVAGPQIAASLESLVRDIGHSIDWKTPQRRCAGVTTHYENLSQLGPDRWLSVIAASKQTSRSALVVNAGTALTVDALTSSKDYLGGTICPGWSLMRDALAQHTARLGRPDGEWQSFPTSTPNAIISGILNALVGSIERVARELQAHGPIEACFLSGGDADALAPWLTLPVVRVDNLVLRGLAAIHHHAVMPL